MKALLIAGAFALATVSVNAKTSTNYKQVSYSTIQSFQREFGYADNVVWSSAANKMTRATFTVDNEKISAFFNAEGDYIASTIDRSIEELPAKLQTSISQKAKGGSVVEIVELQGDNHAWFVKLVVNGTEKLYKGYSNGYLEESNL